MYVYHRQCYKVLKPAAVFPIEIQLGLDTTTLQSEDASPETSSAATQSSQIEEKQTHEE